MLFIIVLLLINSDYALAQKKVKSKSNKEKQIKENINADSQKNDPYDGKINVENIDSFFETFIKRKDKPQKSDFETVEEYNKRLPAPYDSTIIIYFSIDASKNYKYNIETQELKIISGWFPSFQSKPIGLFKIKSTKLDLGTEERSNAYGAKVTIKKSSESEFYFNIINFNNIPDSLINVETKIDSTFKYDIKKYTWKNLMMVINSPPSIAKELSQTLEIIIGVKPISYNNSSYKSDIPLKPSMDYPYLTLEQEYIIDCKLTNIILFDKASKNIIKEIILE